MKRALVRGRQLHLLQRRSSFVGLGAFAIVAATLGAGVGSAAPAKISATPPSNSSLPTISGAAQAGNVLTASAGGWAGDAPITFTYQWRRCNGSGGACSAIAGVTGSSYTLAAADVGGTIRVSVTGTNAAGASTADSNATALVSAGSAPSLTAKPTIMGTPQAGQELTVSTGTWSSTTPVSYSYEWDRCSAKGSSCQPIAGATGNSYVTSAADQGFALLVRVTAKNTAGSTSAASSLSATIGTTGAPASVSVPTIAGTAAAGQTLIASPGSWSGSAPLSYSYQWQRCSSAGTSCQLIAGATNQTYTLAAADQGSTVLVGVSARNVAGSASAHSPVSAVVAAAPAPSGLPPGAVHLPGGRISVPVSDVSLPDQLIVSAVSFSSAPIRSRQPFLARFSVTDSHGYSVSGALVYVLGLPYGWIGYSTERATGADGSASIQLSPTATLPLRSGQALVLFVRARKAGDNPLAGVSTRRLVQVRLAPQG